MGWRAGKPAYGDKSVSRDVRENFEYLKTITDGNLADIATNLASITALQAAVGALGNVAIGNIGASSSGDQTYDIGFEPKVVLFFIQSKDHEQFSIGVDDGTLHRELNSSATGPYSWSQAYSIQAISSTGSMRGLVSAKDANGFTVTYTETGTGSAQGFYLAI